MEMSEASLDPHKVQNEIESSESVKAPVKLPEAPERPLDSDCCGSGCVPCVMDIYADELRMWEAECLRLTQPKKYSAKVELQDFSEVLPLSQEKYSSFYIEDLTQENHNTFRFRCSLPQSHSLGLSLGQHIIIRSRAVAGAKVTRQYTPVSPLDAKGYFELLIKVYANGRMSQAVKMWKIDDFIEIRGPFGGLHYSRNQFRRVLMLCAGTGIAPMCPVISTLLGDEKEETCLRLVYSNHTYGDVLARAEIAEWRRFWNFSALLVLSQEPETSSHFQYNDEIYRGRLNKALVGKELTDHPAETLVLICGTRSFDLDVLEYVREIGVPETHIHKF